MKWLTAYNNEVQKTAGEVNIMDACLNDCSVATKVHIMYFIKQITYTQ